jgi:hypothetical protein
MAGDDDSERSTASHVREYIDLHPSIKDCVRMEIVNLSALARRIVDEVEEVGSEEAALVACRRYEVDPSEEINEDAIRRVLGRSKLEMRTKVAVVTVRPSPRVRRRLDEALEGADGSNAPLHVIRGSAGVTVVTDDEAADAVVEELGEAEVMSRRSGLVELVVTSPEVIEETPGILAYLATTLSSRGINLVEVVSTYRDTIFVIDEEDLPPAFEILNEIVAG